MVEPAPSPTPNKVKIYWNHVRQSLTSKFFREMDKANPDYDGAAKVLRQTIDNFSLERGVAKRKIDTFIAGMIAGKNAEALILGNRNSQTSLLRLYRSASKIEGETRRVLIDAAQAIVKKHDTAASPYFAVVRGIAEGRGIRHLIKLTRQSRQRMTGPTKPLPGQGTPKGLDL